jgi:predicted esterase
MNSTEKEVSYTINNSYSTLNTVSTNTKNVWIVCHGLDFLSRYFIQYFNELDSEENYIIAPQAQSKHYLKNQFKHVGASWLTKENTQKEIPNVLNYLDSVFKQECIEKLNVNMIVLGFSQGVSIVTRWVAQRQIKCHSLLLYAGKVPQEFVIADFKHIPCIKFIVGDKDDYVTPEILEMEQQYLSSIFESRIKYITFDGAHELKREIINSL